MGKMRGERKREKGGPVYGWILVNVAPFKPIF